MSGGPKAQPEEKKAAATQPTPVQAVYQDSMPGQLGLIAEQLARAGYGTKGGILAEMTQSYQPPQQSQAPVSSPAAPVAQGQGAPSQMTDEQQAAQMRMLQYAMGR